MKKLINASDLVVAVAPLELSGRSQRPAPEPGATSTHHLFEGAAEALTD